MELVLRPSNHLIATGPKLEEKTLHIKALSLEWTAILWFELAHMFYRVHSTIVYGERGRMESTRKSRPFYFARERWFGDLIQHLAHSVVSQAFTRRALVSSPVVVLFNIGERVTWWSSWPLPIISILFIVEGDVRTGRGSFPLRMAQLLF